MRTLAGTKQWLWAVGGLVALAAAVIAILGILRPGEPVGPEPVAWGRDTCATCRMHLARPGFAAQRLSSSGTLTKYDDLGCLLRSMAERYDAGAMTWVEDHESGAWIALDKATFVRVAPQDTPMGSGLLAFGTAEAAAKAAASRSGEIVRLDALLADARRNRPAAATASVHAIPHPTSQPAIPGGRPLTADDARAGKDLFVRECSACHGERGAGDGPAARWLDPPPRNLKKDKFRLRSTESGTPPATADVLRTIEKGIPGTAMPPFAFLSESERTRLAAYVLDLADLLDGKEPARLAVPGPAPAPTPESVARGREVYRDTGCAACHGETGKGDGKMANVQKNDDGRPIVVRDFTGGVYRGGADVLDLYYRFTGGMDGSPMPGFGETVKPDDRWALVHFVQSLHTAAQPQPLPEDVLAAGRIVAGRHGCRGCHVLDDGKGGEVGPDLRVSGQKLDGAWIRSFLAEPRKLGKIYPWRPWRMPHLALAPEEIDALARYVLSMGKRKAELAREPAADAFDAARVAEGKNIYALRCTECHNLGRVIEAPPIKWQGPDLIAVAGRVDYDWAKKWILDPKKIDPKTRMTTPGITTDQVEAVRQFVWKASLDSRPPPAANL